MIGWNISIRGHEFPITTILGLAATAVVWVVVLLEQPYWRNVGFGWIALGLIVYVLYRHRSKLQNSGSTNEL